MKKLYMEPDIDLKKFEYPDIVSTSIDIQEYTVGDGDNPDYAF